MMTKKDSDQTMEKQLKESSREGWYYISKEYKPSKLTEEEKAHLDRIRLAEKQSKNAHFVLGGPIKNNI